MSLDVVLLITRIAIALALYAFLGVLLALLWVDIRAASEYSGEKPYPQARLIVIDCEEVPLEPGQEYILEPLTTLGRGPTNTIILPDSFASTVHAHIILQKGQWWLEDRESRNGTTINGVPVTEPVVLSGGDVIGIGRVKLEFRAE
ncbi:MAG TPA: FHA domain-containing protein [Chloroflexi bacterium]|nr:FHA domain-containing protein [Chloroflexota bacterium]